MPILIPRGSARPIIAEFLRLAFEYIFPNCSADNQDVLVQHIRWMEAQNDDLIVKCRFETDRKKRMTRIVLEATFKHQTKDEYGTFPTKIDAKVFKSH